MALQWRRALKEQEEKERTLKHTQDILFLLWGEELCVLCLKTYTKVIIIRTPEREKKTHKN